MNKTTVERIDNQNYKITINGFDLGVLEKSQVRAIIQALDNGVYQ